MCLITPYLAFKHFFFPDFKIYEIIPLLVGLFLNLSSAATPLFFLSPFLFFLLLCFPKILVMTLPHAYLLVIVLVTSFWPLLPFYSSFPQVFSLSSMFDSPFPTLGIQIYDKLLCSSALPILGNLCCSYSTEERANSSMSCFKLIKTQCIKLFCIIQ